jgi:hypothetical protein
MRTGVLRMIRSSTSKRRENGAQLCLSLIWKHDTNKAWPAKKHQPSDRSCTRILTHTHTNHTLIRNAPCSVIKSLASKDTVDVQRTPAAIISDVHHRKSAAVATTKIIHGMTKHSVRLFSNTTPRTPKTQQQRDVRSSDVLMDDIMETTSPCPPCDHHSSNSNIAGVGPLTERSDPLRNHTNASGSPDDESRKLHSGNQGEWRLETQ